MIEKKTNYIAFSLWGDKPIYTIGAIRNAALAQKIYKQWKVIVYYDHTVPAPVIEQLDNLGVTLQDMTGSAIFGPFWRFLTADLPDSGYVIFRDTDSRISKREKLAVEEWMQQNNILHVMRDHPFHEVPHGSEGLSILAGMWGIKGGIIPMESLILEFLKGKEDYYGIDQTFLKGIYHQFERSRTVHDEFFEKIPFPIKRKKYRFVGERIDEYEKPVGDDWKAIKRHYKSHKPSFMKRLKNILFK